MNWHKVEMNDHEFAAFLRKHGAIDGWKHGPGYNVWSRDDYPVAMVVYLGEGGMKSSTYINEELKDGHTSNDRSQG